MAEEAEGGYGQNRLCILRRQVVDLRSGNIYQIAIFSI